jgi:hypothetical protein
MTELIEEGTQRRRGKERAQRKAKKRRKAKGEGGEKGEDAGERKGAKRIHARPRSLFLSIAFAESPLVMTLPIRRSAFSCLCLSLRPLFSSAPLRSFFF